MIVTQINTGFFHKLISEFIDDAISKSSPPKKVSPLVATTSNTPCSTKDRNIKRSTTQIVDSYELRCGVT